LVWRQVEERLDLAVTDVPETGWQRYGPLARIFHKLSGFSRLARVPEEKSG
jgi:hypothetical protein